MYPLPKLEIFATLAGGDKFMKLELLQAFTQIVLDKTSSGRG